MMRDSHATILKSNICFVNNNVNKKESRIFEQNNLPLSFQMKMCSMLKANVYLKQGSPVNLLSNEFLLRDQDTYFQLNVHLLRKLLSRFSLTCISYRSEAGLTNLLSFFITT